MPLRWLAVSAALLLGGCADDHDVRDGAATSLDEPAHKCGPRPDRERLQQDWSKETWNVTIRAPGDFVLALPLPVSPNGTQQWHWLHNASVPQGWTFSTALHEGQWVAKVYGHGSGIASSCSIQAQSPRGNGCCAEQFLDAQWTTVEEGRPDHVRAEVQLGSASFTIAYAARSNWCGAQAEFATPGTLSRGWHDLPGQHGAWCE